MPKSKPNPVGLPAPKKGKKWELVGSVGEFKGLPTKEETVILTPTEKLSGKTKLGEKRDDRLVRPGDGKLLDG